MSDYIGDQIFDELMRIPGFAQEARRLIERDWRTGSAEFRTYAEPLIEEVMPGITTSRYGTVSPEYMESRVMEGLDIRTDPWLWAFARLAGALVRPDEARFALNLIENGKGE